MLLWQQDLSPEREERGRKVVLLREAEEAFWGGD